MREVVVFFRLCHTLFRYSEKADNFKNKILASTAIHLKIKPFQLLFEYTNMFEAKGIEVQ